MHNFSFLVFSLQDIAWVSSKPGDTRIFYRSLAARYLAIQELTGS